MAAPIPAPDELTEPFWTGGIDGHLQVQRCEACGHLRFPPSPVCPRCLGDRCSWVGTSGTGEILSYVVFNHAYHSEWEARVPYAVMLVQLDDGPRMLSGYEGELDALVVGARVHVVFSPLDGGYSLPRFELEVG
jgi:uncharacterized protein